MTGLYIVGVVLLATIVFLGYAVIRPKLKHYRIGIKRVETKKGHAPKKKRKSVWVRIV